MSSALSRARNRNAPLNKDAGIRGGKQEGEKWRKEKDARIVREELEVNGRKKVELNTTQIENFIQIERSNKRLSYSRGQDIPFEY